MNPKLQKNNVLVLSDEMARKQKELNTHERKWMKEATKAWETLTSLNILHKNKNKPVLGSILDQFLDIQEWGY